MISEIIASVLLVSGGLFCLVAGIGIVTLNDVYARMHAATKARLSAIIEPHTDGFKTNLSIQS